MAKTKVSINDIATNLHISKTTVSFILNGKAKEKRISDKLVKKVLDKVEELGYHPNQLAKGLRTGKSNIIGLMVEDISNPFYASIAKKIEDKAYQNNYKIIYCSTENDKNRAREFLTMFTTLGVDGCIIAPTMGIENDIKQLIEIGMDVVLFDRKFKNMSTDVVMVDNKEGMYTAVEHLIQNGYTNIALIALALDKPEKEDRIIGFKDAMNTYGLSPRVFPLPFKSNFQDYVTDIREILEKENHIDALVFGTNYLGISGLEAITNLNLKIPEDLAIVCFDDHDLFRIHQPDITVVAQPIEEIAHTVINTLLENLQKDNEQATNKSITLSTNLIIRSSSQKRT
ncbi:LacI family DNA-binding transcriptional regulator [Gaoshiqia sp. Z1-71]|uniref:LacI family DNA-binding transcriptional regulator n=1 Tax=Gaoshiqia hydrogeniformans TaxID=3290090 RepID=UPI003BF783F1